MHRWIILVLLAAAGPALGVGTSHWTHSSEAEFKKGTFHNVVATNLGDLKLSRAVKTLLEQDPKVSSVYALAATKDGAIYAGTGPQGVLLKITGEKVEEIAKLDGEVNIFSLGFDKDGALLIGTGGEKGKIYRLAGDKEKPKEIFSAEGVHYIWCITTTPDGKTYAGTGPNGQLFEVQADGKHEVLLDSEQNNLLCMISDGQDLLYAGSDPEGLVYRVNRKNKEAYILYDAAESEISALALDEAGNLYAATAEGTEQAGGASEEGASEQIGRPESNVSGVPIPAPPAPAPKPPEVPNPNPGEPDPIPKDAAQPMFFSLLTDDAATTTEAESEPQRRPPGHPGPTTGPVHAPPAGPGTAPVRGEAKPREGGNAIYRIDKEGLVTEVFRQPVMVLSMIVRDGALLIGTGSEGQVYEVHPREEETVVLAKVDAKQVMALLPVDGRIIMGLANSGGLAAMTQGFAADGTYTSPVLDAEQISRFGHIELHGALPAGTSLKVQTRSGNIAEPSDEFWSKWTEPAPAQQYLKIAAPSARFLQYRLSFAGDDKRQRTPVVDDVDVSYQVPNQPPAVKSIKIPVPGKADGQQAAQANAAAAAAVATIPTLTISWEAEDANSDELIYSLFFRDGPKAPWILLKDKLKETTFEWDTRAIADGRYEIKVVASDEQANAPGTGRKTSRISDPVLVVNTPPAIGDLKAAGGAGDVHVEFKAFARSTALVSLAYAVDSSSEWQTILPNDKITDSPEESARFTIQGLAPGQHQVAVRATDARGNQGVATVTVTVDAPAKP